MHGVEQRGVLRSRGLDVGPRGVRPAELERDGDDLDALGMQLCAQYLPPGQIVSAPSIGSPGDEHHLLTSQRGEPERRTVDVIEHELRCRGADQGPPAQ